MIVLSNSAKITLLLLFSFAILFIHPYYVFIMFVMASLYVKFPIKPTTIIFSLAFAFFWSSRNFRVEWSTGRDDTLHYLNYFSSSFNQDFINIFRQFFISFKNAEPLFYIFTNIIGIFTRSEWLFAFTIYFVISILLFTAAVFTDHRQYLLIVFLFLFGLGAFSEGPILHLWRATLASLILYIGVIAYTTEKLQKWLVISVAGLTHLATFVFVPFIYIIDYFHDNQKQKKAILLLILIIFISILFISSLDEISKIVFGRNLIESYFLERGGNEGIGRGGFIIIALSLVFYITFRGKLKNVDLFVLSLGLALPLSVILFSNTMPFYVRIAQFFTLFYNYMVFRSIQRYPKSLILAIIPLLFTWKMVDSNSNEMISTMFNNFTSIFNGILFHLNNTFFTL